jgi:quercetin dioxygenase-like cupin family protein
MRCHKLVAGLALIAVTAACAATAKADLTARALSIAPTDLVIAWGPCPPVIPTGCEIAVLRGDPSKPQADVYLRIAPGAVLPAHTHTSGERMILAAGELLVTYRGQPPAMLTAGSYAYGPPGLPHKAVCRSATPCVLFIAFEEPVDAIPYAGSLE